MKFLVQDLNYVSAIEAMEEFQKYYCTGQSHTPRALGYDVAYFREFIASRKPGASIAEILPEDIRDYQEARFELGESPATVERRMCTVRKIFKHVSKRFPTLPNPCQGLRRIRIVKTRYQGHTDEEVRAIMESAESSQANRRQKLQTLLFLELCFKAGARAGDLRTVTAGQVDLHRGLIVNLRRKNSVFHNLPLTHRAVELLEEYLPLRHRKLIDSVFRFESLPEQVQSSYPLFPGYSAAKIRNRDIPKTYRINERTIYRIITMIAHRGGVVTNPHRLRHTFALKALEVTGNIRTVSQLLGHGDVKSSMPYTVAHPESIRAIVNDPRFNYGEQ